MPAFCQFWQRKTDATMLCRQPFDFVHVRVRARVRARVRVRETVKLFLPAFCRKTRAGKAEFLPISAGDDTMLCRWPFQQPANTCCRRRRLSSGVSVEGPPPRRPAKLTFCQLQQKKTDAACCTNVYTVQNCRRSPALVNA